MYQVLKILNNNTILAKEGNNEIIILAKGIGFGKKINDHFEIPPQAKKYMMQKNYQAKDKLKKVIDYLDPVYLEIAAEIIKEANGKPYVSFDGDQTDPNVYSEAQYETRVQALVEMMEANLAEA